MAKLTKRAKAFKEKVEEGKFYAITAKTKGYPFI